MAEAGARVFVGRNAEVEGFQRTLASARTGVGHVVLVSGEPGIGKSRLLDEIGRMAGETGWDAVVGRCYEVDGAPALWPWMQVLRALVRQRRVTTAALGRGAGGVDLAALVPELVGGTPSAPPADPAHARFLLFEGVTALLRYAAAERPLVVALDDVHRADVPSLRLLEFAAAQLRDAAVVIVLTFRDSPHDLAGAFGATLGALAGEAAATRWPLAGLGHDDVARVFVAVTGAEPAERVVAAVHARTGGNPLFVTELSRQLAADDGSRQELGALSAEVRTTLGHHITEVSLACAAVLTAAAVLGREFRIDVLAVLVKTPHETVIARLAEAARCDLVRIVEDDVRLGRFAHVLTRDVLYDGIPEVERAEWHRRAGEALVAVTAGEHEPPIAELAAHFARAGDARAVDCASAAGAAARRVHAYEEAAERYAVAVAAAERATPFDAHRHCDLLLELGEAQRFGGGVEAAKRTVLRAAESARARADAAQLGRAALTYGVSFDYGEGAIVDPVRVGLLNESVAAAGSGDTALLVRLLGRLALARYWDVDAAADRDALTARSVAMARRLGDADLLAEALIMRHHATWAPGSLRERLAIVDELDGLVPVQADAALRFQVHWLRAADHLERNDVVVCDRETAACAAIAEGTRHPYHAFQVAGVRAMRAAMRGDLVGATRLADAVVEIGGRWFPMFAGMARAMLALALVGRPADWEALAVPFRAHIEQHPGTQGAHALLALVLCELGRVEEARAAFTVLAAARFATIAADANALVAWTLAADVASRLDDPTSAEYLYRLLAPYREQNGVLFISFMWRGCVAHRLGTLARVLGRHDEAAAHLEDALSRHARAGDVRWLAETRFEYARVLCERGRREDAARAAGMLDDAVAAAERLGLATVAERFASARLRVAALAGGSHDGVERATFRRSGERWIVAYAERSIELRASRGLEYLAALLYAPQRAIPVTEIVGGTSTPEQARVAVTKGLGAAIAKIRRVHPDLAAHLTATIRRGSVCAYLPDPQRPIVWEA